MLSSIPQPVWLLVLNALPVFADFTQYVFAGVNSNGKRTCPGSPFECPAPSVCSFDSNVNKYYCCISGAPDAVCWGGAPACSGGNSTTPSGGQQLCALGSQKYCCAKSTEECTENTNQINICWSTLKDPLIPLNATRVNQTYSSITSALPAATTYSIAVSDLLALTSTTPEASHASTSSSPAQTDSSSAANSSGVASTTATVSPSNSGSKSGGGLSAGAIGGIVGGIIGGFALLGIVGFFFSRRRNNQNRRPPPSELYSGYGYPSEQAPLNELASPPKYAHYAEVPTVEAPVELAAHKH